MRSIKGNRDLSQEGKDKQLVKALDDLTTRLSKLDKAASITEVCRTCEALVFNATKKALDENKPKDVMLDYLQASEMRQYLHRLREEKRKEHTEWLAEQERAGVVVPDQMRAFHDPVEHLFLESCRGYSKERDQLYRAITEAPFPVQLLPADTLQKGRALLEAKVAPVQVENLAQARARQVMYASLWESALKMAEKPETLQPYQEPRQILSDEQRASQTPNHP